MKWFKYIKVMLLTATVTMFTSCYEEDVYRGQLLSGRWFGDLGMMVDGIPAIGSDLEFIPEGMYGTQGYGYETDYYRGYRGRIEVIEYYFTWSINNGIIYMRFDNPDLDCSIRDYSLSADYFEGYMDGIYSSSRFSLQNYDRYWYDYGYYVDSYCYYRNIAPNEEETTDTNQTPRLTRKVNMATEKK